MARSTTTAKAGSSKTTPSAAAPRISAKPSKVTVKQRLGKPAAQVAPPAPARARKAAEAVPSPLPSRPKQVTVTLKHLAAGLSKRRGLPRKDAEAFAADLIAGLLDRVKAGAKVRIAGLGVIEIKDRPARTARNPATGAPVQVEASRKVVFRAAKELKDAV